MSQKFQKPRFQSSNQVQFRERTVGEKNRENPFKRGTPSDRDHQDRKDSRTFRDNRSQDKRNRFGEPTFSAARAGSNEKSGRNRPYVEQQFVDNGTKKNGRGERSTYRRTEAASNRAFNTEPQVSELTLKKAGSEDNVKVWVKSLGGEQPRVKKTGPLSPRAPEKIKKNRGEEMKVYGENACLTLFEQRPESIVRVWATVEMSHKIGEIFSYLAQNKKVYHVVDSQELALVSGTEHHGGICMLVKKARPFTLQGYLDIPREDDCLVLLDGVRNAQNIGGVLRTCAFYGIKNVVVEDAELLNSSITLRIAEGGAEYVRPLENAYVDDSLAKLRQSGYQIVHISSDKKGENLDKMRLKNKVVFVLSEGSTQGLATAEDTQVKLTLANPLKQGLNIAVNTGVLLSKWYFA